MNLSFFIALRYLRSKKSINIINMVSYISLIGIICGTAALLIVLSVFNGFENLTSSIYSYFDPELKITPKEGKTFIIDSSLLTKIYATTGVESVSYTLEENVLLKYKDQQTIATMKGVDKAFETSTEIQNSMYDGSFTLHIEDKIPSAVLGYGVANKLGVFNLRINDPIFITIPKREGKISPTNPTQSLNTLDIYPKGIYAIERSFDDMYVFAPLEFMQELLEHPSRASAIEIILSKETDIKTACKAVEKIIDNNLQVKTRHQQNEAVYRMMKSEKLIVYAILILIVLILSFNISGSLSMLITEKKEDIATLQSMGATDGTIKSIFFNVGILITILGIITGMVIGLIICLAQQYFGLLKLPGNNLLVDAYPVKIIISDLLLVIVSVFLIGYFASIISVVKLKNIGK